MMPAMSSGRVARGDQRHTGNRLYHAHGPHHGQTSNKRIETPIVSAERQRQDLAASNDEEREIERGSHNGRLCQDREAVPEDWGVP